MIISSLYDALPNIGNLAMFLLFKKLLYLMLSQSVERHKQIERGVTQRAYLQDL